MLIGGVVFLYPLFKSQQHYQINMEYCLSFQHVSGSQTGLPGTEYDSVPAFRELPASPDSPRLTPYLQAACNSNIPRSTCRRVSILWLLRSQPNRVFSNELPQHRLLELSRVSLTQDTAPVRETRPGFLFLQRCKLRLKYFLNTATFWPDWEILNNGWPLELIYIDEVHLFIATSTVFIIGYRKYLATLHAWNSSRFVIKRKWKILLSRTE